MIWKGFRSECPQPAPECLRVLAAMARDMAAGRGRLVAAVAFVLGSSSAALPAVAPHTRRSTAPDACTILDNRRSCGNIHTV
jgi:hypothetical protein